MRRWTPIDAQEAAHLHHAAFRACRLSGGDYAAVLLSYPAEGGDVLLWRLYFRGRAMRRTDGSYVEAAANGEGPPPDALMDAIRGR